jgi:anion-transporting  ArsA/GET3 family ATPase
VPTSTDAVRDARGDGLWDGVRLHVVSGKGGVGKTTVAAALALGLAAGGRRTLLCEVEGRQGLAPLFDVPQLPYAERRVARPSGGETWALSIEPKAALLEYLDLFYHLGRAGKVLERLGAVDFATTIAPGLRDVLLTGKVYESTRRRDSSGRRYDAVVLDAPPTGRLGHFLNVNEEVVGLAKVGPIRNQAGSIMSLLRSDQTAVHLVTVLEEMPVQETVDAAAELARIGLPVGAVVINMIRDPMLAPADLTAAAGNRLPLEDVATALGTVGLGGRSKNGAARTARLTRLAAELAAEGGAHARRVRLELSQRSTLTALGRPVYELPALPDGVDLGALYALGERLAAQGLA